MKNKYLLIILFAYFVSFELISQRKDLNLIQTSLFDNIPVRNIGPAKVSGRITKVIKDYLNSFENKIYGITGDPKKVFLMSKSWGILSEKIFTEDGNYLINHSSSIILLKDGKYLSRISHHANYECNGSKKSKYFMAWYRRE